MNTNLPLNSMELLKRAALQAYPDHKELSALAVDGTLVQAWQSMARLLGIDTVELARKLAPVYGVPLAGDLYGVQPEVLGLAPLDRRLRRAGVQSENRKTT